MKVHIRQGAARAELLEENLGKKTIESASEGKSDLVLMCSCGLGRAKESFLGMILIVSPWSKDYSTDCEMNRRQLGGI